MELKTSVQYLMGVGPKMMEKLKRLGIETVRDLLFYWPRRYDDFSKPLNIAELRIGSDVIIKATIRNITQKRTHRRWMSIIYAELSDDTGTIKAIWFNQPFLIKILKPGDVWLFAGKVNWDFKNKNKTLSITQYENLPTGGPKILAIYPETEGITSKYLRKIIQPILLERKTLIEDYLPSKIIKENKLLTLENAILQIHQPQGSHKIQDAQKRLGFDELFLIALRMLQNKKELSKTKATALIFNPQKTKEFVKKLPFTLTDAQRKCTWEIIKDLGRPTPMNRLLEGDVGSGKTVVGAIAVLMTAQNNLQSVWLAPTEILANQHYQNVTELLKPFKIKVGLLTAAHKESDLKKDDLIIGTHALLQKNVQFERLGLIIIDEQHRFGVKQRAHLKHQSTTVPHLLSMTATPIPRTLALALYGDLDISILNEMPKGRQKVLTRVIAPEKRDEAYNFIRGEVQNGRQVFVICPLIEANDNLNPPAGGNLFEVDRKSAIQEYQKLSKIIFPDLKIGLLHGRLKAKEKDSVMKHFNEQKLDILVSTAVVEVGIDIPNATVMMIESAERFGLAQLHQFRGRVGRSQHQSYCLLFSESSSFNAQKRLNAMTDCHDGFKLAEIDLSIRGPGELVGIRQSGLPDLKMASLSDTILVKSVRTEAEKIISEGLEKYPSLDEKLQEYESESHLE